MAGKMVAMVAHCFSVVNAVETFKLFLPYLFDSIEEALKENPNMHNEEHVDAKFLFNFLILSEVCADFLLNRTVKLMGFI